MIALPKLTAMTFQQALFSGSTHPCVFTCQDEKGAIAGEYVVKFRSEVRGNETGLLFEFVATHLAGLLAIPVPPPALIELTEALAEATPDASVADRIRRSAGLNFGTRFLSPGYATWPTDKSIPRILLQTAVEIVAFDALIDNADRRRVKPNLLHKGDDIYVFDHEMAFAFVFLIGELPTIWTEDRLRFLKDHPLHSGLRGQAMDLSRFASALRRLGEPKLRDIIEAVPAEWRSPHAEKIVHHLGQARDHVDEFVGAMRRVLA